MILKIRAWCEGIIIAIIISIIIEMLLPEGKNKKYVKVVIGIYVMFVVLNPILEILNYDIKFEDFFGFEEVPVSTSLDSNMRDVYVIGIQESIKQEIEEMGYIVKSVSINVDSNYENIEKIELSVKEGQDKIEQIEPIIIGNKENKSDFKYTNIIAHLVENYSVSEDKIVFK